MMGVAGAGSKSHHTRKANKIRSGEKERRRVFAYTLGLCVKLLNPCSAGINLSFLRRTQI